MFSVASHLNEEFVDITQEVQDHVDIDEGMCLVYCPHTTAGLTINEGADPAVQRDILAALDRIVPKMRFEHAEGNSPAHIKASIVGCSVLVPVEKGKLQLGTWQKIFLCEFDGPRKRNLIIRMTRV